MRRVLVITCPHCGPRNSNEFSFHGEPSKRPSPDGDIAAWRRYLYLKQNLAGWEQEQWFHVSGCRRFLVVERDTTTNEIQAIRDAGEDR